MTENKHEKTEEPFEIKMFSFDAQCKVTTWDFSQAQIKKIIIISGRACQEKDFCKQTVMESCSL